MPIQGQTVVMTDGLEKRVEENQDGEPFRTDYSMPREIIPRRKHGAAARRALEAKKLVGLNEELPKTYEPASSIKNLFAEYCVVMTDGRRDVVLETPDGKPLKIKYFESVQKEKIEEFLENTAMHVGTYIDKKLRLRLKVVPFLGRDRMTGQFLAYPGPVIAGPLYI